MSKFADDTKLKWKANAPDWHQKVALYIQWKEPWPWRKAELTLSFVSDPCCRQDNIEQGLISNGSILLPVKRQYGHLPFQLNMSI